MKRFFKFLGALVGLALTAVMALAVALFLFDPNENKDWIARKFQEQTGRELSLDGNIALSFYPWLGLELERVAIGNAAGFSDAPLLAANELAFRIKTLPLLSGRYEIDTVRVDGLRLSLEVAGNGVDNWSALAGGEADSNAAPASSSGGGSSILNNLVIGGVAITDAALVYDDAFANTRYEVSNLEMSIGELVYGNPLDINLSFDASSRSPQLAARTTLQGTALYDMDRGRYDFAPLQLRSTLRGAGVPNGSAEIALDTALSMNANEDTLTLSDLVLSGLGMRVSANVQASRLQSGAPALTAELDASGSDLATLFRVLQQDTLAARISSIDGRFSVQANLDADLRAGTVRVPGFDVALLGATITGHVDASNINDSSALRAQGELDARGPDLPLLMQVAGTLQGGRDNPLSVYGDRLRQGLQDRSFSLRTGFNADLGRGSIELPALDASLLGFTARANLNARDLQSSNGLVSGELQLRGERLREVLRAVDQAELAEVAQSLQLDLQVGGSPQNLRLSPLRLDLVLAGRQIPNSPQTLSLNADTVLDLEQYNLRSDSFSLSGLGLNLNGSVAATRLDSAPSFEGRLEVPAFNARSFMRQLNLDVPPTSDPEVLQRVALRSAFGGTQSSINLNDLQLNLDDSTITGSLAVSDLASLATQFNLSIDSLDADRYLAPATTEPSNSSAEASPLPQEELQALNVKGSVKVGELVINRLQMQDILVELNAVNGQLALAPFQARLYNGSFDGDIRLDASGATPAATVSTTLSGVDLGPLLQDFMDSSYVSGRGNVRLDLRGSGSDTAAIKRNLDGSGSIQLQDGVLQGVDVTAVLRTVETMIRSRSVQALPEGGSTAFEASAATLDIASGVITTNDLSVTAPGWSITGNGMLADLPNERIGFELLVSVDESSVTSQDTEYNLGGYALPIACSGALDSPRCLPDARQIIAAAVGNAVQQRLGDFLQERLGGGRQQTQPDGN